MVLAPSTDEELTWFTCGNPARASSTLATPRSASTNGTSNRSRGVVVASLIADVTVYLVSPVHGVRLPRSIAATDLLVTLALVAGSRLLARTVIERPGLTMVAHGKEVLVVGAGDAGRLIVQEMQRSRMLNYTPIGFVDDDPRKRSTRLMGVRVLGTLEELPRVLREHRPDEVLIAMPSVSGDVRRRIVESLREHYAMTLRHWNRRLAAHEEEAKRLVGEEAYRVWRLHMAGAAYSFAHVRISIYQSLLAKPDASVNAHIPLTRRDIYQTTKQ